MHVSHLITPKVTVYLGAVLTPQNSARDEVNRRTAGAGHSYRQLQRFVFNNPEISATTKLRVFQTMVMPVLLYCMHLVPLRKSDQRRLDSWFHTRVRWILGIRWEEKITNQEVQHRAAAMLGQFLCPPFPKPSAEEAFMWAQSREDWRLISSTLANTD